MTIKRIISSDKVRAMCIKNDYCTYMTNDEYSEMLRRCYYTEASDEFVIEVAEAIMKKSDVERRMKSCGYDHDEMLCDIVFELINDCTYTTVEK